jgi:hypothetical protein
MNKSINLSPIEELLENIASPESVAQILDSLAFDYARLIIELEQATDYKSVLHEKTADFIWWMQHLRDVFRACGNS